MPNALNDTVIIQDSKGCFFYIHPISMNVSVPNEIESFQNKLQEVCEDGQINLIYDKVLKYWPGGPNRDTVFI